MPCPPLAPDARHESVAVYTRPGDVCSLSKRRQPTLTHLQRVLQAIGFELL